MKTLTKDIKKFTKGSITLGIGSAVGAGLAAKAPGASVTPAFSAASGMMPLVGTTMMGSNVMRMTRSFQGKKKGRRYKTAVGRNFAIGFIDKKKKRRKSR